MVLSDISPRTQAYADKRLLKRSVPNNILGQFGQVRPVPRGSTKTIKFRRYESLDPATTPLTEGVTPTGKTRTKTDYVATLQQFGDFVMTTDVIRDVHEDPILMDNSEALGEQAGQTIDILRAGILVAGTNVIYANGAARSSVNTPISDSDVENVKRTLGRQEGKKFREVVTAGPNIGSLPVPAAFIGGCHVDCERDLTRLTDWIPVHKYASQMGLLQGEIGSTGAVRWVVDNNLSPTILGTAWTDAGGSINGMVSTTGAQADVYPMLIFAKDAYGVCGLGGKGSVQTYVANPKATESDPLAQRGTQGWKGWNATVILNDNWMVRLEVACTTL